jgi:hypothetical protein
MHPDDRVRQDAFMLKEHMKVHIQKEKNDEHMKAHVSEKGEEIAMFLK